MNQSLAAWNVSISVDRRRRMKLGNDEPQSQAAVVVPRFGAQPNPCLLCGVRDRLARRARVEAGVKRVELSPAASVVWAKSDRDHGGWLPLSKHMTDSAEMAAHLWDGWLPSSVRRGIAQAFGADMAQARAFVTWMACVHDLGKASPAFAVQVEDLASPMRSAGLAFPRIETDRKHAPHSVVSHILLERWLVDEHGWERSVARTVAVIPGGHHGVPPSEADLDGVRNRPQWLGDTDAWKGVQRELSDYAASYTGVTQLLILWAQKPLPMPVQTLVTAIVIIADWLASNTDLFRYGDHRGSKERAAEAWQKLALPGAWQAEETQLAVDDLFARRFHLPRLRPMQRMAVVAARTMSTPGLMIIEDSMGAGKTEASLAAAEAFAARTGAGGCILALPTMATTDAMFSRVRAWIENLTDARGSGIAQSLYLAHGKARLNEVFQGLVRAGHVAAVGDDYGSEFRIPEETVIAHEWLYGRKRGVLANFVVGTIDQVLFGALKSRHVVLRHLALANKVVIVDEVHAADTYMLVYLRRVLSWLGAYSVPTILLSATLPPDVRRSLAEAYAEAGPTLEAPLSTTGFTAPRRRRADPGEATPASEPQFAQLQREEGYPLLTTVTPDGEVTVQAVESSARVSEVRIERIPDDLDTLGLALADALSDGGCVGVIRNTVARAQETADYLRERFPKTKILLAHSRFIATDRVLIDNSLRELLGPPTDSDDKRHRETLIVVGTQVLEQSLDIDFDLMVSDLAPMDLLLQRMGRLHRHERPHRPPRLRRPRFLITGVEDWDAVPPEPARGSVFIYRSLPLLRTLAVLNNSPAHRDTITLPTEIAPLVRQSYGDDVVVPAGWEDAFERAREDWGARIRTKESKAATFLLGAAGKLGASLVDWLRAGAGDADEDSPGGQAQVRDTEDSIEVLVVQRVGDEIRVLPGVKKHGGRVIDTERRPPHDLEYAVAGSSIRLPPRLCQTWRVDRVIGALERNAFPGWQQSPLLKGQLVLVLDEGLHATIDGSELFYDKERGLKIDEPNKGAKP